MRSEAPEVEISEIEAARLDRGTLVEITGPSLFSSRRAAVIYELENLNPDLGQDLVDLATEKLSDLAIILVHGGGAKGKGLARQGQVSWRRCHRMRGYQDVGTATVRLCRGKASRQLHRGGRGSWRSSMRSVTTFERWLRPSRS